MVRTWGAFCIVALEAICYRRGWGELFLASHFIVLFLSTFLDLGSYVSLCRFLYFYAVTKRKHTRSVKAVACLVVYTPVNAAHHATLNLCLPKGCSFCLALYLNRTFSARRVSDDLCSKRICSLTNVRLTPLQEGSIMCVPHVVWNSWHVRLFTLTSHASQRNMSPKSAFTRTICMSSHML